MSHLIRSALALAVLAECLPAQAPTNFCFPNSPGVINCPCNNPPLNPGQQGCDNYNFPQSGTGGAFLQGSGSTSVANDTLTIQAFNENHQVFSLVLESRNANAGGIIYGAGVRCVTAPIHRLYGHAGFRQTDHSWNVSWGFGAGDPSISSDIGATAGETTYFQAWYRDPNALNHCPGTTTFNVSTAVAVFWGP